MSKKLIVLGLLLLSLSIKLYGQGSGTPSQLRVKTDAQGYLVLNAAISITNPVTQSTFNQARLKTDANGYLLVTADGGIAPANLTYILQTASASAPNAQSLGTLNTGLLLNTKSGSTGTLSQYAGVTCTTSVLTALSSAGAGTCTSALTVASVLANSAGGSFSTVAAPLISKVTGVSQNMFLATDTSSNVRWQLYLGGTGNANTYWYDGSNNLYAAIGQSEGFVIGNSASTGANGFLTLQRGAGISVINPRYANSSYMAIYSNTSYGMKLITTDTITDVLLATFEANTNVVFPGKLTTYNNLTTAGFGVDTILGENISTTKTGDFTALSVTPASVASRYEVSAVITTTSSTNTGTVQITVDYVDSQGTTHTADIIPLTDAAGVIATTKSGASKEYHSLEWKISINNAGTAIVLKVVTTGSVSYTVSPTIKRIA